MLFKTAHDGSQSSFVGSPPCFQCLAGQPSSSSWSPIIRISRRCSDPDEWNTRDNRSCAAAAEWCVTLYRCLECDQIQEFRQLVIEDEQLLAEHKRMQSAPFSASEHTEHRRQIAAHGAKVPAFRSRVFGPDRLRGRKRSTWRVARRGGVPCVSPATPRLGASC